MAFVALNPFWRFLSQQDIAALSTSCVVCCSQRTWNTLQVIFLGRQADDLEDIVQERVYLRHTASGDL
eukprot:4147437-Karenia_brevis.AAC.1